jgi:CRP-like cAMP-binding protein
MAPARRVKILVDVTTEMRDAVERAAQSLNTSRNQIAVLALATRYGIPADKVEIDSEFREVEYVSEGPWSVSVPITIRSRIRLEAARRDGTVGGIVRAALAEMLGLPEEPISRRPRRRETTA